MFEWIVKRVIASTVLMVVARHLDDWARSKKN